MVSIRVISRIVTWAALGGAFACAVVWWTIGTDLEPAVNSLVLLSAISGLFVERWVRRLARRREILHAVLHELLVNQKILQSHVYDKEAALPNHPRALPALVLGVVDSALSSGVFLDGGDEELFRRLHLWRARAQQLNRRLEITESRMYQNPSPQNTKERFEELRYGRTLKRARREMKSLMDLLTERYPREAGAVPTAEGFLAGGSGDAEVADRPEGSS